MMIHIGDLMKGAINLQDRMKFTGGINAFFGVSPHFGKLNFTLNFLKSFIKTEVIDVVIKKAFNVALLGATQRSLCSAFLYKKNPHCKSRLCPVVRRTMMMSLLTKYLFLLCYFITLFIIQHGNNYL